MNIEYYDIKLYYSKYFFLELPKYIKFEVLNYLDIKVLCKMRTICKLKNIPEKHKKYFTIQLYNNSNNFNNSNNMGIYSLSMPFIGYVIEDAINYRVSKILKYHNIQIKGIEQLFKYGCIHIKCQYCKNAFPVGIIDYELNCCAKCLGNSKCLFDYNTKNRNNIEVSDMKKYNINEETVYRCNYCRNIYFSNRIYKGNNSRCRYCRFRITNNIKDQNIYTDIDITMTLVVYIFFKRYRHPTWINPNISMWNKNIVSYNEIRLLI